MDNFDPQTMNNIKNLVDNGNISDAISKISPEMIENFSKMMNSNNGENTENTGYTDDSNSTSTSSNKNTYNSNFDFSKLDMHTILKLKTAMEKINNSNDPRSNLLYSLKPYLRQTKQDKLDQYVNLLNFSQIADVLKNDKKDGKGNV